MIFSVIVPTFNRKELLKRTLGSLFEQDFQDYEIIVVNDGGTDGSHEFLAVLEAAGRIRYFRHENSGLAATRKLGLAHATGELIAFTDDDCVVPENWLQKLYIDFRTNEVDAVGGPTKPGDPHNPYAEASDMMSNFFKEQINPSGGSVPFMTGNNVAYTKRALESVGGPDPRFRMGAEDRDLLFRVIRAGGKALYDPALAVEHHNDADFIRYVRHQYDLGKGSWLFYALNRKSAPPAIPARVYLRLLGHPFKVKSPLRACLFLFLILLAQGAVTAGFIAAAVKGTPRE